MPVAYLDVPPGLPADAKKPLVQEIFTALDEAYRVPDTRIFVHEWPSENVSQDGRLDGAPPRPVVSLEVPPGISVDARRSMVNPRTRSSCKPWNRPRQAKEGELAARRVGADDYLVKPFDPVVLLDKAKTLLGRATVSPTLPGGRGGDGRRSRLPIR